MSNFDGLLDLIPVGDIAKQLGVPQDVAEAAVKQVIPAIIGGMAVNAQDADGQKSLESALSKHATSASGKKVSVKEIDTADGEKIVNHVFGAKKNDVVAAVADTSKSSNVTQELIAQLLPIIAPIVISFVAKQFLGQKDTAPAAKETTPAASSGGIGDLLGGLLGSSQGQEIIGGVLGGLLGGKK
ncbi:MAG: DUF937 domain-containing protein [Salinibacterium sp.]|nr:DUF937 domain-containing protein [Salinibacterium sp.]